MLRNLYALSTCLALPYLGVVAASAAPVDYAAKIAPIWQEHCLDCHANDDPDGDLVMETFAGLMKGGKAGKAVVPGNSEESLLVKFLEGRSGKSGKNQFMPPGKRDHLKPDEIAMIRGWIDAGAPAPTVETTTADVLAKLPKIAPKNEVPKAIHALAFSEKAKLLAAGGFASVQLVDPATRQPVRVIKDIAGKVNALAFSADGQSLFAAAGDAGVSGIAYQFRVSDGSLVRKFEGHTDALYALALSPDGMTLVTGGYDQGIRFWNIADGKETRLLKGHNGGVFGLSFRPDGKVLASTSADRTVKLWEVATGKRLDTLSQPLKEQNALAFAPDGKTVVAGGADNRIRVWSVTSSALEGSNKILATRFAHEGTILNLAFSADGKTLISTASNRSVKLWDVATLTEREVLDKQTDWSPAVALLDGNRFAIGRLDGTLSLYDLVSGKSLDAPPMTKAAAAATANGKAAKAKGMAKAKPVAPGVPDITRAEPRGVQSGATTTVKLTGKNLKDITAVKFANPMLKATVKPLDANGASVELAVTVDAKVPRSQQEFSVVTANGESAKVKLSVDYLPQIVAGKHMEATKIDMPVNVWGTLAETGQHDSFRFAAKQGETVIFDLAAKRIDSKAVAPRLEVFDANGKLLASNNGLDSGSDPFIAFTAPRDGEFTVRVLEVTLEGSADHAYRLTAGVLPYVTGWWPLSLPANSSGKVQLVGHNLKVGATEVKVGAAGEVMLPLDTDDFRSRVNMKVSASTIAESMEQEPNDAPDKAQTLTLPGSVNGRFYVAANSEAADADHYALDLTKGQQVVLETRAAMEGSPADTKIEVLDAKGVPVPMMKMQATKDSSITLRSEDANDPAIRLFQFAEMALNDYMYYNGEVLKIFRLARGPDADMVYYSNGGKRRDYFNTSPAGHGLDEACYVVEPKRLDERIVPNGLPIFTLNYTNDDDGDRVLGSDSRLIFTAPETARYLVRVSDTRGWSGPRFAYRLIARAPQPDYSVQLLAKSVKSIPANSGAEFGLKVERADGWDGDVRVDVSDVPPGFFVSTPLVVQAGHLNAAGSVFAYADTKPGMHDFSKVKLMATAMVNGKEVKKPLTGFGNVTVTEQGKKSLFMEPDLAGKPAGDGKSAPQKPYEITLAPGTSVSCWLRVDRHGDDAIIALDVENLPHGVIVDNIGLNGVQIRAGENEREVFLTCSKWVAEQDRLCHVVVGSARNDAVRDDAAQTGFPVLLKIRKSPPVASK